MTKLAMGTGLALQQKQDLRMTADLRQAIEMLQFSALDVQALVRQELADNPCLEVASEASAEADEWRREASDSGHTHRDSEGSWDNQDYSGDGADRQADMAGSPANMAGERSGLADYGSEPASDHAASGDDWSDGTREAERFFEFGDAVNDTGVQGGAGAGSFDAGMEQAWEHTAHKAVSLQEHLVAQLEQMVARRGDGARLRQIGKYLIDGLDESGYLRVDLAEVAARLRVDIELVDDARALVQMLEPLGVGARDLQECLKLQLHARDSLTPEAEVCLEHLDRVAARDWAYLARVAKVDMAAIVDAVEDIRACNPKPGLSFGYARTETVVPDVVVMPSRTADGAVEWRVELNGAAFPRLLANPMSLSGLGSGKAAEQAKTYARENFGKAKWLIGALEQRAINILKVARAIVAAQGQFLEAGPEFLVPLTMRQVAERVGVHESTVSRVSRGKYMQTPLGVFEFTHFFASGIGTTGGQVSVAAGSVQAMIARLVKAEDPRKPLSDEQIVARLKTEGVDIARRTVAKYRGVLNIPGTSERRVR